VELVVEPRLGRVDTVPSLAVHGAQGPRVRLEVVTTDAAGHRWRSSGEYPVGQDGVLMIDDVERPWWDMAFADPEAVPVAFTAPDTVLRYDLSVAADGEVARADLRRSRGPTRPAEDLPGTGFVLRVYRPDDVQGPASAVVVVPGSTGLSAMAPTAALLAAHGYVAAVLGYMQERGLPPAFRQIPVESILGGLRAFAELPEVDDARMGVLAVSVGTVAALVTLSGADAPTVGSVVVESPTHVVWQALAGGGPPPKAPMLTPRRRGPAVRADPWGEAARPDAAHAARVAVLPPSAVRGAGGAAGLPGGPRRVRRRRRRGDPH